MGLFGKSKSKTSTFNFYVRVHSLSPWPAQYKSLAVSWQRGTSRKGITIPVNPTVKPGRDWNSYEIEQGFHIPCTLYQVGLTWPDVCVA